MEPRNKDDSTQEEEQQETESGGALDWQEHLKPPEEPEALEPEAQDPPPWPESWGGVPRPVEPPTKDAPVGQDPPPWPDEWGDRLKPVQRTHEGAPKDSSPPAWPASWGPRPRGAKGARGADQGASDKPAAGPEPRPRAEVAPGPAEPFAWRTWRAVANPVRTFLGFRRIREYVRVDYVPLSWRALGEHDDDPRALRRIAPIITLVAALGLVAFMVLWAYGVFLPKPDVAEAYTARETMLEAIAGLQEGRIDRVRDIREQLSRERGSAWSLHFLDGYLLADADEETTAVVDKLGRTRWSRPKALRELVMLAGYREASGDVSAAAEALAKAVALSPDNTAIRLLLASACLASGQYDEVIRQADALEGLSDTPSTVPLELRGRAYLAMGNASEARRQLSSALIYDEHAISVRLALADALAQMGDYVAAGQHIQQVLAFDPDNAAAFVRLGYMLEAAGRRDLAESAYRDALKRDPGHPGALNNLAYLLGVEKGKPAAALSYAKKAYELAPQVPSIVDTLGWINHLLGRPSTATRLLRKAVSLDPQNWAIKSHLAQAMAAEGDVDEAKQMLRQVVSSAPDEAVREEAGAALRALDAPPLRPATGTPQGDAASPATPSGKQQESTRPTAN